MFLSRGVYFYVFIQGFIFLCFYPGVCIFMFLSMGVYFYVLSNKKQYHKSFQKNLRGDLEVDFLRAPKRCIILQKSKYFL